MASIDKSDAVDQLAASPLKENSSSQQDSSITQTTSPPQRDKDGGIYMRKLQLMKVDGSSQDKLEAHQLRISTDKLYLNTSNSSDKWEELIISGRNIQNRSVFASVIHKNTLYVYGGYDITAGIMSDFHKMNLSNPSYSWEKIHSKNPKKSPGKLCKSSAVVYKDKMYLVGGQYVGSMDTNRMYSYDFATETWDEIIYAANSVQLPCIDSHRAVIYQDTMILVSGYLGEFGKYSQCVYQFNFTTRAWSILYNAAEHKDNVLHPRIGTDIALVKDRIYLYGGYDGSERLNDLYYFDIKARIWKAVTPHQMLIPKTRRGHSLNVFGDFLILFGGIHDVTWELDDLYVFDIKNNRWLEIDGDSARRKEYSNVGDISPTKPKQQQRQSYKRTSFQSGTMRSKSIILASPLKSGGSALSPTNSPDEKKQKSMAYINDPYFMMAELSEQQNSPTKNLENQKKREFFQRKADMLAMLTYDEEADTGKTQRQNSNSPTSEAMKNALITIGNPMPELKVKKGKTTDFGRVTFSKFLEPIKSSAHSKAGKKPCARDGHVAIVNGTKLYIFGGDRHKMSFNDLYMLNLEELKQQQEQQQYQQSSSSSTQ